MDRIRIRGGNKLNGTIEISGAKNAALPLMITALLTPDQLTLHNVPRLVDVQRLQKILGNHGVDIMTAGKRVGQNGTAGETLKISAKTIVDTTAPYELVSRMRASFWVLGPLIARMGEAKVSLPGGCAIGTRPVDMHLLAMEKLGAHCEVEAGYVIAKAKNGLTGGHISFPKVSVGATHAALLAAVLAKGDTTIENAATEPEIGDVAECLVKMGAKIEGIHTRTLHITGVTSLHGAEHTVVPDRIETGTYAMAAGMAGGDVLLRGARAETLENVIMTLQRSGVSVETVNEGLRITRNGSGLLPVDVTTDPYRFAGAVHGPDDQGQGHITYPRNHFRKPLHACAGTGAPWCRYPFARRYGGSARREKIDGCRCDGNRSSRLGDASHCRAGG
jgi:UDP-N-acetylglucosamine 1-carboxyvinyltransferase